LATPNKVRTFVREPKTIFFTLRFLPVETYQKGATVVVITLFLFTFYQTFSL